MLILSLVVGLLFLGTGGVKVAGLQQSLEIRNHFDMTPRLWRNIGLLESAGGLGVLLGLEWAPMALAALIGLALLMSGAVISRLRVRDPLFWIIADGAVLTLVVTTAVLLARP